MVEHRSAESEGLRVDSSWGLRIFSSSHARDKTKKHLSRYRDRYPRYHSSYGKEQLPQRDAKLKID